MTVNKKQKPGRIKWNFIKVLIDKQGKMVERFAPTEKPGEPEGKMEEELKKNGIKELCAIILLGATIHDRRLALYGGAQDVRGTYALRRPER